MNRIIANFLIYYLTEIEGITWRPTDYNCRGIIKSVKGESFGGYFQVKIGNSIHRFDCNNSEEFLPIIFRAMARGMEAKIDGQFTIVPIPNSSAVVGSSEDFRTWSHARAIAANIGDQADVIPALRWNGEKLPAHKGGSRDPQVHFDKLRVVQKPQRQVVIFDDVITTGSQLIGATRRLDAANVQITSGFMIGRATKEQPTPMIEWRQEEIVVEDDPIDWDAIFR